MMSHRLDSQANLPQIKICGLTDAKQASGCAKLGADAIGCVFFPKSPRFVSDRRAREICRAVRPEIITVGVFVDASFAAIMQKVEYCGLTAVQLHGRESTRLARQLDEQGLLVIKALFVNAEPSLKCAGDYAVGAFIVEYGRGELPGGNALTWEWRIARDIAGKYPLILAGGLSAQNVGRAIRSCRPDAVDVSSGVESAPGQKDLEKVKDFIQAVRRTAAADRPAVKKSKTIF